MKKIAIDLFSYDPNYGGGVNTFTNGLIGGLLKDKNFKFVFITSNNNNSYFKSKFNTYDNVCFLKIEFSYFSRLINRLIWIISFLLNNFMLRHYYDKYFRKNINDLINQNADFLIAPYTLFNFYALKIPTILCIHDIQHEYIPENFSKKIILARWASYRLCSKLATYIQCSSKYISDCILEKFTFISSDKIFLSPEGVDLEVFKDDLNQFEDASINFSLPYIFYPAQLWKHKNHYLLLHALKIIEVNKKLKISCYLTGSDYGYGNTLLEQIKILNLSNVHYLGRVDQNKIISLYKHCSAVMALGLHESSSLPVREGASFGKPLICSNIPPNIEISSALNLIIFDKNCANDLANKICDSITDNKVISEALENKTKIAKYGWAIISKNYIEKITQSI